MTDATATNPESTSAEAAEPAETVGPTAELEWVSKAELETAQKDAAATKDRLLRLQADFDNFRRRTNKERDELFTRANESIMSELLTVLDHMDLALTNLQAGATANAPVAKGFQMVADQLRTTLGKFGLKAIDASGVTFDANLHESLSQAPSDTVAEGVVLNQVRKGYKLGDKLLRPARVIVSSGPTPKAEGA